MKNLKPTLVVALVGAAVALAVAAAPARAAAPEQVAAATAPAAPAADPVKAAAEKAPPATSSAEPMIQISGRLIHTWMESPGLRVILVIDGFTVLTGKEQLTARDGCLWFDEEAARKSGKAVLGIYAETGVEYKTAGGALEKFDSVYLVMESGGEVNLHSDEAVRQVKADGTELFLRAKKLRKEFLASGRRESPTGVVSPPAPGPKVEPPGVKEAGVPQEITIVAQDDVRQVNFTSFVEDGMRISLWSGGVYVMRGETEIAADNLVIWVPEEALRPTVGQEAPAAAAAEAPAAPAAPAPAETKDSAAKTPKDSSRRLAAEAYFEGHVRVNQGHRTLQCSQMYYDFRREQALAINTKIKTFAKGRNIPVYYYANEVRQLAKDIFIGTDAWMTTCEFAVPHYDIGAKTMTLTDLTPSPGEPGEKPQYRRVRFVGEDVQARIREIPLTYWPRLAGDVSEAETALRTIRIENRRNRGVGLVTEWHLLKLLGVEKEPPGFNFYLNADVWSKRGPALGVESEYKREDYFGKSFSYFMHDTGSDSRGKQEITPPSENRYWVNWRHRQYLPQNWELTLEFSKLSDRNFLNEYFEKEYKTGKTQETDIYLKKQELDQALTILLTPRLNAFQTLTEYYPQIGYNMIGHSLWQDHLTYFQDSELSVARYRPDNALPLAGSGPTLLADTIHELDLPLKAGVVNVVPFAEGRLSYFGDSLKGGSKSRVAGRAGARTATQASRVYDNVESDLWNLHRMRHVNIFDASGYASGVSVPSRDLFPFDVAEAGTPSVEGVDGTGVVELGWRQRFQTMRGPEGKRESVDWLTLDLEGTFYSNRQSPGIAPDGKRAYNHIDFLTEWKTSDTISVWTDTNFNTDQGALDMFTIGAAVTHTPRLTYTIGQRLIPDANSSISFIGFDYKINEKWWVSLLEQYDWDQNGNATSNFTLTRRLHRWLMRIKITLDPSKNEKYVGLEFQPLGVPQVRFGT